jgi:chromosome partitioning protein
MGKIIAVANQKGGVGKTTTVINIAAYLGSRDFKVLCVDADPQGNTTTGFGIKKKSVSASTYDVITGKARIQEATVQTEFQNVSIVPATEALAGCEIELAEYENRVNRLKMQILTCKDDFDYIIIDCSPSLGLITVNALTAADSVIIPVQAEYFALEGISKLLNTIRIIKGKLNASLRIEGLLLTMYDARLRLANEIFEELKGHFGNMVFNTVIPRNIRISEAPSHGVPVILYDPDCRGSISHMQLAQEIISRDKKS